MFRVRVDDLGVKAMLLGVVDTQLPFAMSLGLNLLGKAGQKAVQDERIRGHFQLRRQAWNVNSIRISKEDRATKTSWKVVVQVDPRASYFDKFEEEGIHEPFGGRKYLWVPDAAVFRNKVIQSTNPLHPKALQMHKVGGRIVGKQRTFMVTTPEGPLVLQRVDRTLTKSSKLKIKGLTLDNFAGGQGPRLKKERISLERNDGTRCLYVLRSRVKVPLKLEFIPTISRTVQAQAEPVFREAIRRAVATAR